MQKDFWKGMFCPENKKMRSNIFLALAAGLLLLAAGRIFAQEEQAPLEEQVAATQESRSDWQTEARMAEILSRVEGAGAVDVMLTYRKTQEQTLAREETREESHTEENGRTAETLRTESAVVLTENGKGSTEPILLWASAPQVEGVVIVAQGGGDAAVCQALNEAAQALLDVPAHKIAVLKMK